VAGRGSFGGPEAAPRPVDALLIDDDPDVLEVLAELLESQGYTVVSVSGGDEALRYLQDHLPPALIVADLMMPGMSAIDLMERLPAIDPGRTIPVVVFTAASESYIAATGLDPSQVVRKPDLPGLLEHLSAAVARRDAS
jgi:CheY-like chemotaxis protein